MGIKSFINRNPWLSAFIIAGSVIMLMIFLAVVAYVGCIALLIFSRESVPKAEIPGIYKADVRDENYNIFAYDTVVVRDDGTYIERYFDKKNRCVSRQSGEWSYYEPGGGFSGNIKFKPRLLSYNKDTLPEFISSKPDDSTNFNLNVNKFGDSISLEFDDDGRVCHNKQ